MCRPDADAKDVLWLLATHPEARAFLLAAAMAAGENGCCWGPGGGAQHWLPQLLAEGARKSERVTLDSLLSFDDCDDVDFVKEMYDMVWLEKVCALTRLTWLEAPRHCALEDGVRPTWLCARACPETSVCP